jgi:hypothetical protein
MKTKSVKDLTEGSQYTDILSVGVPPISAKDNLLRNIIIKEV